MPILPPVESLSLAEQVAQMVVVRASGYLFDHQIQYPAWEPPLATLRHWVQDLGVGGVILLGGSAAELALRIEQIQGWAAVPLLVAADVEEGVGQRFAGATEFPPPMALGAIAQTDLPLACQLAAEMGGAIAQEAQAIGLNWVLAPVVDVNNNPSNPVINVRAFGETPELVGHLASAFIQGASAYPVLTCAKHFPGHGDTATDSHLDLPQLPHDRDRLQAVEWPPFAAAIAKGVDAVMSAHLLIPHLDPLYPATLSPRILDGELRQRMGFEGLIVTDALVMGAIANRYGATEAPVLAVEAGADILLMPVDPAGAIQAVVEAVETGRIPADRIRASVDRIWRAKAKFINPPIAGGTSHAWESLEPPGVDAPRLLATLAQPATHATQTTLLRHSTRTSAATPLSPADLPSHTQNLIICDDALASGLTAQSPAIALPNRWGCSLRLCDRHSPPPDLNTLPPTVLQLFIRGNPFRGSAGLHGLAETWFQALCQANQLQALLIYGSPYILEQFLPLLPPEVPYGFSYGQMDAAQAILLNRLWNP